MYFFDLFAFRECENPERDFSVALGTFDGVHIGHRQILRRASECGLPLCAVTFAKNPFGVPMITTLSDKLKLFADCGARYALIMDFDEIKDLSAKDFISEIVLGVCRAKYAFCGFNYRFGKDAGGTPEMLSERMEQSGGRCVCIPAVTLEGETVSSSKIRTALSEGDIARAEQMLGRRYSVTAKVIHGNEIGRTIGFPTVNFEIGDNFLLPQNGVYITTQGKSVCITDIGTRPTVTNSQKKVCETHIIGAAGDFYGREITIEFHKKIRNEMKFSSLDELSRQLERDKETALCHFIPKD